MKGTLRVGAAVLLFWSAVGCNERAAPKQSSVFVPPKEVGYELVTVVGSPGSEDRVVSMQGYPRKANFTVRVQGHEYHGDGSRDYLVHAYDDEQAMRTGYVIYAR